jgi:nitroreductase
LIGLIAVRDRYDKTDSMRAGRIWQRIHLLATARGLAARPSNEAVEMVDYERLRGKEPRRAGLLTGITGDVGWQPTFVFYMGYPIRTAPPSPRRSIDNVVL